MDFLVPGLLVPADRMATSSASRPGATTWARHWRQVSGSGVADGGRAAERLPYQIVACQARTSLITGGYLALAHSCRDAIDRLSKLKPSRSRAIEPCHRRLGRRLSPREVVRVARRWYWMRATCLIKKSTSRPACVLSVRRFMREAYTSFHVNRHWKGRQQPSPWGAFESEGCRPLC